jgi:hypothetical protein
MLFFPLFLFDFLSSLLSFFPFRFLFSIYFFSWQTAQSRSLSRPVFSTAQQQQQQPKKKRKKKLLTFKNRSREKRKSIIGNS